MWIPRDVGSKRWARLLLAGLILASGCTVAIPAGLDASVPTVLPPVDPTVAIPAVTPSQTPTVAPVATSTRFWTKTPVPSPLVTLSRVPVAELSDGLDAPAGMAEHRAASAVDRPRPSATPTPNPLIPTFPPNVAGEIPVLMYHVIGYPESTWTRTPENLRQDLEFLISQGFYPVNLIDLAQARLDQVPLGRRPVVLTFDDSTAGQFLYWRDGTLDPNCAVAILLDMHDQYGADWPLRATFFVIPKVDQPGSPLFGQSETGAQKVRALVDWGMEVGSHTVSHQNLRLVEDDLVEWELAVSQNQIEALVPGYRVQSLALPEGGTPQDIALLAGGFSVSAGLAYSYAAAVKVGSGPAPSPFSPDFDPYHIPRIRASQDQLDTWFGSMQWTPERYYSSDGGRRATDTQ